MIILEFSKSPLWLDIRGRVLTTFGFLGVGHAANAIPPDGLTTSQAENLLQIEYLIRLLTLISYGISILVAVSVLWRFILWLKDRNNNKK